MDNTYDNFTALKALEEIDKEKAIQVISDPLLDGQELSEIIECSLLGKIVDRTSGDPIKLDNTTMMAAIRNRFKQLQQ
jgi:hypothetical protein